MTPIGKRGGTGMSPASQKRGRCRSCGGWSMLNAPCLKCGRDPTAPVRITSKTRECTRCHLQQPVSLFRKMPRGRDGLHPYCRSCSAKYVKELRARRRKDRLAAHYGIPEKWKSGQPGLSVALEARVWRLLDAAFDASSTGLWRGRAAIHAYRMLRTALDEWSAPPEAERVLLGEETPFDDDCPIRVEVA